MFESFFFPLNNSPLPSHPLSSTFSVFPLIQTFFSFFFFLFSSFSFSILVHSCHRPSCHPVVPLFRHLRKPQYFPSSFIPIPYHTIFLPFPLHFSHFPFIQTFYFIFIPYIKIFLSFVLLPSLSHSNP